MQGRQRSPFDNDRLRKEDSSSLTIGRRARKQVLDLIERKATIFQLGWTAFGNIVHRRADLAQWSKSLIAPPDIRELGTSRDKVVVPQLLPLPEASPRRQDHHLAVAHGLRISQSKDSGRLKLRGKDLGAFADIPISTAPAPGGFAAPPRPPPGGSARTPDQSVERFGSP